MHAILKLTLCSSLAILLAACASTPPTPTLHTQLQAQLSEINTLNQKLRNPANTAERRQLLEQRQRAIETGAHLINQAQVEKLAARNACLQQQKNLPTDVYTCTLEESMEDTQLRMLGLMLQSTWDDTPTLKNRTPL